MPIHRSAIIRAATLSFKERSISFDSTIPQANANLDAVPIRANFNALKGLIDALSLGTLKSGDGNLDGSGILDISGATSATFVIGSGYGSSGTDPADHPKGRTSSRARRSDRACNRGSCRACPPALDPAARVWALPRTSGRSSRQERTEQEGLRRGSSNFSFILFTLVSLHFRYRHTAKALPISAVFGPSDIESNADMHFHLSGESIDLQRRSSRETRDPRNHSAHFSLSSAFELTATSKTPGRRRWLDSSGVRHP